MADTESRPLLKQAPEQGPAEGYQVIPTADRKDVAPGAVLPPDELPDAKTPAERRRSLIRWLLFWAAVVVALAVLISLAVKQGDAEFDWKNALKKAGGGVRVEIGRCGGNTDKIGQGLAGAMAMVAQVLTLMPLRTVMNYQYRYGGSTTAATKWLWNDGGFTRFYSGLAPALVQGPIARFGDTAANAGIIALLNSNPFLKTMPAPLKTIFSSSCGALFRMVLVPIDTYKTAMQTQGKSGVKILHERVKAYGVGSLWYGAWATAVGNFVGSFPWFAMYNWLSEALPPSQNVAGRLLRQAFIGFAASVVSDTISNSLRVLKTYRQVNQARIGYREAAWKIIETEGWLGLFGRGLKTRILANGLQGIIFSVLWKLFQDLIEKKHV